VAAAVDVGMGVDDVVVGGHGPWDMHTTDVLGAKYGANGTHFSHTPVPTSYSMPQFATP